MKTKKYIRPPQEEIAKLKEPQQFLKFFEAIPANRWCTGTLWDDKGRCCARGHLGVGQLMSFNTEADRALLCMLPGIVDINNGESLHPWYKGLTIKGRVTTALKRLIAGKPV